MFPVKYRALAKIGDLIIDFECNSACSTTRLAIISLPIAKIIGAASAEGSYFIATAKWVGLVITTVASFTSSTACACSAALWTGLHLHAPHS